MNAHPRLPWTGIMLFSASAALLALVSLPTARLLSSAATGWADGLDAGVVGQVRGLADVGLALAVLAYVSCVVAAHRRGRVPLEGLWAGLAAAAAYPFATGLGRLGDGTWPSAQSAAVAALAVAMVLTLRRTRVVLAAGTLVLLVAVSHIASGAHHVHDVASGVALGALLSFLVLALAVAVPERTAPAARDHAASGISVGATAVPARR